MVYRFYVIDRVDIDRLPEAPARIAADPPVDLIDKIPHLLPNPLDTLAVCVALAAYALPSFFALFVDDTAGPGIRRTGAYQQCGDTNSVMACSSHYRHLDYVSSRQASFISPARRRG